MEQKIEIGNLSAAICGQLVFLCVLCGKICFATHVRKGANSMSFGTMLLVAGHELPSDRRTVGSKIGSFGTTNRVCEKVPKTQTRAAQRLSGDRPRRAISNTRKNRGGRQVLSVLAAAWRSKHSQGRGSPTC